MHALYGIDVAPSHRRKLGRCLVQMSLGWRGARLARALGSPDAAAMEKADLVIDLSGDALSEDYGIHVVLSHLYPIWLALQMRKTVMLCAQTLGPFGRMAPVVRRLLSRVAGITVRDRYSEGVLRDLGVRGPTIERTADMAHLLEPAVAGRVDALLAPVPAAVKRGPVLGATVSRLLGHRQSPSRPSRGEQPVRAFSDALSAMSEHHGANLLLLAHSTGPRPARDDRIVTRALTEKIGRPDTTYFAAEDLTPAEAKGVIARCDLFCAMRLHSAIAALSSGVPCVVVAYGPKAAGLLEDWGQTDRALPVADLNSASLLSAVESVWRDRDAIRIELSQRRDRQMQRARANIGLARSLLGN